MNAAPSIGTRRELGRQVWVVTWHEGRRRLQRDFGSRSEADAFRKSLRARFRSEPRA